MCVGGFLGVCVAVWLGKSIAPLPWGRRLQGKEGRVGGRAGCWLVRALGRGLGQQPPAWLRARPCKKKVRQAVERTLIEQAVRRVPAEGDGQKPKCKHLDGQSRQQ